MELTMVSVMYGTGVQLFGSNLEGLPGLEV